MSDAKADVERGGPASIWPVRAPWPDLPRGTPLTVVKLAPDGSEVTRYPGAVAAEQPVGWLAVEARWVNRRVHLDGLSFITGDRLLEYFSPAHPFNVFAVYAPEGGLRGWYANVTYPSSLDPTTTPPILRWHDLYLDVVALPDGRVALRDEDELAGSGLADQDPPLHAAILAARQDVLDYLAMGAVPFHRPKLIDPGAG